jgi:ribose/xylose/arabinose/galactoside ABC-type transport system permease subunit
LVTSLSNGGALFLFRHSIILFTSEGSVTTEITFMAWPHFGHTRGSTSHLRFETNSGSGTKYGGWVILNHTILGRSIFAIGGNREASRVSGLKVDRIKIATYTMMGMLAAVAGIVLTGRMNSANALMATGVELKCIAAVVIGGTNLFGGEGTIIGSLIGAIIMGVLGNGLNLLNVSAFWQRVIMGLVIVGVVIFDQWRRRRFAV